MVVKKTTRKTSKKKYKIVIELPFGPFGTTKDAVQMKKQIKAKIPKIVFSANTKSRKGVVFKGRLTYIQAFTAPMTAVKQVLKSRVPGAKVSVTKV